MEKLDLKTLEHIKLEFDMLKFVDELTSKRAEYKLLSDIIEKTKLQNLINLSKSDIRNVVEQCSLKDLEPIVRKNVYQNLVFLYQKDMQSIPCKDRSDVEDKIVKGIIEDLKTKQS